MAESIVETTGGRFRGVHVAGVRTFLGIRYGAAPVGDRRFRASVAEPAHAGVRDAFAFGASAVQLDARLRADADDVDAARLHFSHAGQTEGAPTSEDCLTLNVWSPAREGAGLPVIVWVHGGAFRAGSASGAVTDGERLAATGRVVVVSVGHRLGVLGFTALPDVPGSGYAGLTDIVLALEWVRDNIAVFGGDPARVTVAGQSGAA